MDDAAMDGDVPSGSTVPPVRGMPGQGMLKEKRDKIEIRKIKETE
jgi:hypothetical protein